MFTALSPALYRLAGQDILFEPPIPEMQAFLLDSNPVPRLPLPENIAALGASQPTLQAAGLIADRLETISVWRSQAGTLLDIPAAGRYWTSADGRAVCQVSALPALDPLILAQSLLGPPLMLALARRGVWCLHASAIAYQHRVAVFLGISGAGKSTLAAYLGAQPGVRQLGDDILPVALENGALQVLPHFPQLKLPPDRQPGLNFPESLPLSALYLLDEQPAISFEPHSPASAAMTLASHSVAARLFDRDLLSAHFDFCTQAGSGVPVRRLSYPRIYAQLPAVWRALQADLEGLHD